MAPYLFNGLLRVRDMFHDIQRNEQVKMIIWERKTLKILVSVFPLI